MEEVKIEIIKQPTIEVPNYSYGNGQNTLDYNIAIRNTPISNLGNTSIPNLGFFFKTSTGNISITGVGFKPNIVIFNYNALYDTVWQSGNGAMSTDMQYGIDHKTGQSSNTKCIYLLSRWGNPEWQGEFVSLDSDGFTINITALQPTTTLQINYICL